MTQSFQLLFGADAQAADAALYDSLVSLEVEENADLPGAFQVTLPLAAIGAAGHEDLSVVGEARWAPYARVAVVATAEGHGQCIFDGYVLSHKIHAGRGTHDSTVQIWGQDASCLMNLEEKTREWTGTDGNNANTIFRDYNFTPDGDNLDDDSGTHPVDQRVLIQRGTDAQFLRDRARRGGKLFRVVSGARAGELTGTFAKPRVGSDPVTTLTLNPAEHATVDALDFDWDVARPTEVLAKSLVLAKDPVDGGVTTSGLDLLDQRSLAAFVGSEHAMKLRLTASVDDANELQSRAHGLLRDAAWFVRCEGEVDLARVRVVLRVGTVVQIGGAGRLHSGKYYVWSVRHTITAESHRMRFVLVRNAVGSAS